MAQSREQFMRSLGLTPDDVKEPAPSAKRRDVEDSTAGGTAQQQHPQSNQRHSSSSEYSAQPTSLPRATGRSVYESQRTAAAQFERMGNDREDVRPSYASQQRQPQQQQATSYRQSASYEREEEEPTAQQQHKQNSSFSHRNAPTDSARADFLKSMGIDNADHANDGSSQQQKSHAELVAERRGRNRPNAQQQQQQSAATTKENISPTNNREGMSRTRATKEVLRSTMEESSQEDLSSYGLNSSASSFNHHQNLGSQDPVIQGVKKPMNRSTTSGLYSEPSLGLGGEVLNDNATAEEIKTLGNKFYERGDYRKAVRLYTKAIEKDTQNAALYSNRSAAYLLGGKQMGLDSRTMALRDADMAIKLRPEWFKGYSRRGDALFKLERLDEALAAYETGLERDPQNTAVKHSIQEVLAMMPVTKTESWSGPTKAPSTTKNAYELMAESEVPEGDVYRVRELEKFRAQRTTATSSSMRTSTPGLNDSSVSNSSPTRNDDPLLQPPPPSLNKNAIPQEFSTDAALDYQANLIEAFRKKKAQKEQRY